MDCCMSSFLCLDPEVHLRKREPSLSLRAGYSASLVAAQMHEDQAGSDSTYSMPSSVPHHYRMPPHPAHSRSQTLPMMMPVSDSQTNFVLVPVVAGSQPGLNYPMNDVFRYGFGPSQQFVGDSAVGASSRNLATPQPPPVPLEVPRSSNSAAKLSGRHLSGDSAREADEEETLIE